MSNHKKFMERAIKLAEKQKGLTHPNPTVGAVIVKDGKIIGEGFHEKAGEPHAEVNAINDAISKGHSLENSTMYITLEPCCHYGKTPPCTNAIITHRIKQVVVATLDPNPMVAGNGIKILKEHNIDVLTGILEDRAKSLNEDFFTYIKYKRPFIHLKWAQSIDGKIATSTGSSKWITSKKARKYAHLLRKHSTGVLVGIGTALKDNPSLTVRHIKSKKQPVRILIDKNLDINIRANILDKNAKTIIFTTEQAPKEKLNNLSMQSHIKIIKLPLNKEGKFDIDDILKILYKEEIIHLLVEGGKGIITQFVKSKIFDKISVFIAPRLIGEDGISSIGKLGVSNIDESIVLKKKSIKSVGNDILIELYKNIA